MKKIFVLLLCILTCFTYSACSIDKNTEKTDEESSVDFSLPPDTAPTLNKIDNDEIAVIQWGEKCEWINNATFTEGLCCYTFDYLDIIEATFLNYDNLNKLIESEKNNKGFNLVKNGGKLEGKYDGIIAVSYEDAENILTGTASLIDRDYKIIQHDTDQSQLLHYIRKGNFLPLVGFRLTIPEEAYELAGNEYGFYTMGELLKANEIIREKFPNYPVFENGATIKELKAYYYLASQVLNP